MFPFPSWVTNSFSRMRLEDDSGYWLFEDGSIINFEVGYIVELPDTPEGTQIYSTTLGVTVLLSASADESG